MPPVDLDNRVLNALTVDVEDYYHVSAFDSVIGFDKWSHQVSRIEANTAKVVALLDSVGVRATFFVLGWVAERFPAVVRSIHREGHEIASHGYAHRLIYEQEPAEFEEDVRHSLDLIQQITGEAVLGYRAPSFSVTARSSWALAILRDLGLRYDCSVCPGSPLVHRRYGLPGAPVAPYQPWSGFWEFPLTTIGIRNRRIPVAGGGWLRAYPYWLTRRSIERINRCGRAAIVYVHPWEFDPHQPSIPASRWRRFLHHRNLDQTAGKLAALCRDFAFAPVRDVLGVV